MSSVTEKQIVEKLTEALEPSLLNVIDDSGGCGAKFSVLVVSSKFEGITPLERHRKVNEVLQEYLPNIHALSLKTWTPAQYEKKKNEL